MYVYTQRYDFYEKNNFYYELLKTGNASDENTDNLTDDNETDFDFENNLEFD